MSTSAMSVHRLKPLHTATLRGRFLVPDFLISATRDILVDFALQGISDGGHEGIVYWAGRQDDDVTVFLSAVVPAARHGPQGVFVDERAVGAMARAARGLQCGILSQIHSHPGRDCRHSDGDDDLVLMPFEGMLSIVLPRFGIDFSGIAEACVHQFQDRRWVLCTASSVGESLMVLPPITDLR